MLRRALLIFAVALLWAAPSMAAGTFTSLPAATVPLNGVDDVPMDQGAGCPTSASPCTTSKVSSLYLGQPIQTNCSSIVSPFPYQQCIDTSVSPPVLREYIGAAFFPVFTLNSSTGVIFNGSISGSIPYGSISGVPANSVLGNGTGSTAAAQALTSLPAAVQLNITQLGTIASGVWQGSPVGVSYGGTGGTTATAARAGIGAAASGDAASSGITMNSGTVLARSSAGNGPIQELSTLPTGLTIPNATITGGSIQPDSLVVGSPTGGSEGSGTINTAGYLYQNGNVVVADLPTFLSTFIGAYPVPSLTANSSGGVGDCAGIYGTQNLGIGEGATSGLTNACLMVGVGYHALHAAVHDVGSVAVGAQALQSQNGADPNTAVGYTALGADTTGGFNAAVANGALQNNLTGNFNTAMGAHAALSNTTANDLSVFGSGALFSCVTGCDDSSAFGSLAMFSQTSGLNSGFGEAVLYSNISGNANSAFGNSVLQFSLGDDNTAMGESAGFGGTLFTASGNSLFGKRAGYSLQTGANNNLFAGAFAGYGCTACNGSVILGGGSTSGSLTQLTTGQAIVIGWDLQVPSPTAVGQLDIANFIYGTGLTGTGTTISTGKIGFGIKAPAYEVDVVGDVNASGVYRNGGSAGVSCVVNTPAHITVVGGIVTLCN